MICCSTVNLLWGSLTNSSDGMWAKEGRVEEVEVIDYPVPPWFVLGTKVNDPEVKE